MTKPTIRRDFSATVSFCAVGQGLFGTGKLNELSGSLDDGEGYTWVYDCGTNSAKRYLNDAIDRFGVTHFGGAKKPTIDLVVVSHFDHDHISGLVYLLSKFRVKDLLLPYVPLWQRLEIAFVSGAAYRSALTRFLVNPIAFIAEFPEGSVERILFAGAGGSTPEVPPHQQNAELPPDDRPRQDETFRPWRAEVDANPDGPDADERACLESAAGVMQGKNLKVGYIKPGGTITVDGLWEFVPYNDCELAHRSTKTFVSEVARLRGALLDASDAARRHDALDKLKDKYDKWFGKSGLRRNVISLFMYAGPFGRALFPRATYQAVNLAAPTTVIWNRDYDCALSMDDEAIAVLYTGDGFLDTATRLSALRKYIKPSRFERIRILQVMHHGSRHNWYEGVAKQLKPALSVFSSDPNRKRSHPHAEVVKDFLKFGPVQVDTESEIEIEYWLYG